VIGRTFLRHLLYLRKVFQRFRDARLKLNQEKCQLLQKEVRYLGHIISPEGITTDPEKLKAAQEWPTTTNKHENRSFLVPSGGHLDVNNTLDKVRQRYYWLKVRNDVENWCRQCDQGNRYHLIAMDYFTKCPEVHTIPHQEASTIAKALVTHVFSRFGVPRELHSDQRRNFRSCLIQEDLQCLGVSKTPTTPLHPQMDGMVERYIKTVEKHLWKVVASDQRDWDAKLPIFLLVYRASTHDPTGLTAARLVFGRELRLPSDLLFETPTPPWQGKNHNRSRSKFSGPCTRHPQLCPATFEVDQ
jgi:hypothetical protein